MNKLLPFLSLAFLAACNANTEKELAMPASTQQQGVQTLDTTGYAKYQDWKAKNELAEIEQYNAPQQQAAPVARVIKKEKVPIRKAPSVAAAPRKKAIVRNPVASTGTSEHTAASGSGGDMSSEGNNTAKAPAEEKKRISTTAKTTVIGAAGGAVIGAVVNKKNRAAGAVIGGVLGGGGGYVLGKVLEKKEAAKKAETAQIN